MAIERRGENGYLVSGDPAKLDLGFVHGFLATSYWARSISREVVEKSVAGSLCFGGRHLEIVRPLLYEKGPA